MVSNRLAILEDELKLTERFSSKALTSAKLIYYSVQRPLADLILSKLINKPLRTLPINNKITVLLDEGGMHKEYIYKVCNNFHPLKGSTVLVPGVGYGRHLIQLASCRPAQIVAFDQFEYPEEWSFITETIKTRFGVYCKFIHGEVDSITSRYQNYFDFIITEAVLEHVSYLEGFVRGCSACLKKDGIFYASFGPLWYGPCGDHIEWGADRLFDHLILSKEAYKVNFDARFSKIDGDSTVGAFMVIHGLFSYLKAAEYFETFDKMGYETMKCAIKFSTKAWSFIKNHHKVHDALNKKGVPEFDRFCSGIYFWMKYTGFTKGD